MESTVGGKDAAIEPPRTGLRRVDERECPCLILKRIALQHLLTLWREKRERGVPKPRF